jgi:hypothetical protein
VPSGVIRICLVHPDERSTAMTVELERTAPIVPRAIIAAMKAVLKAISWRCLCRFGPAME